MMGKGRLFVSLICMQLAISTVANAETVLKFGMAAPEKTPWAKNAHDISKSVDKATDGAIKIQIFPGSQLGNEQDVIRQVARGRIHMGSFSNTAASLIVPEIALLAAPYLWSSLQEADCVLDEHLISVFQKKFVAKGLRILGWSEVGQMGYAFRESIGAIVNLSGKKIRVAPTKASAITARNYGANSVPLPITEVASALQTGMVDGADLPSLAFTSLGLGKIAPNWLRTNHSHQVGVVLISEKTWKRLSLIEQEQFLAAQTPPQLLRKQVRGAESFMLAKFVEGGGNVINPSDTDLMTWRSKAEKSRNELVDALGNDAEKIYKQILDAKEQCGKP